MSALFNPSNENNDDPSDVESVDPIETAREQATPVQWDRVTGTDWESIAHMLDWDDEVTATSARVVGAPILDILPCVVSDMIAKSERRNSRKAGSTPDVQVAAAHAYAYQTFIGNQGPASAATAGNVATFMRSLADVLVDMAELLDSGDTRACEAVRVIADPKGKNSRIKVRVQHEVNGRKASASFMIPVAGPLAPAITAQAPRAKGRASK